MHTESKYTKQFFVLPAAGKRLIAKAVVAKEIIKEALQNRTIVVAAGTTNGYVAEELLRAVDQLEGFSRGHFFRGVSLPHGYKRKTEAEGKFIGDVILHKGQWKRGKTIFDVADTLEQGDIVFKGGNAYNPATGQIGLLIGHPKAGTILPIMQAVHGKRVRMIVPIGLEKRIYGDLTAIASSINDPQNSGLRYFAFHGEILTEIEAVEIITGAKAELIAGGGISGAEGGYWLAVTGTKKQLDLAEVLFAEISKEPNFAV